MIRSKRWKNKWKRRWFTCDGRQFFYCKTAVQNAVRAAEIDLTMASIRHARSSPRDFCFEVVSSAPGGALRIMVLQAESAEDMDSWIKAVTAGISAQLDALAPSDVSGTGGVSSESATQRERQLAMITSADGNGVCADCMTTEGVEWCSLNLGVVLCLECAGVHRGLGVHISQCRSFKLDVMDESILSMFGGIGNKIANSVWDDPTIQEEEGKGEGGGEEEEGGGGGGGGGGKRPTPSSSREDKEAHVKSKYVERKYVRPPPFKNSDERDGSLIDAAAKGDMERLLRHVAWKTDLDAISVHGATALSAAAHRGHPAPITLLLLNHADVNRCGEAGWSPLHAAAYGGKDEAVRLLMSKGGNEYAREKHSATPIDIAQRCGNTKCVMIMGGSVAGMASVKDGENGEEGGDGNEGGDGGDSGGGGDIDSDKYGQRPPSSKNAVAKEAGKTLSSSTISKSDVVVPVLTKKSSVRAAARRASIRKGNSPREIGIKNPMEPVIPSSTAVLRAAGLRISGDNVTALFDFNAESTSELSLKVGEKYVVLKQESSSGWTYGQNDRGEKGLFPTQYVQSC